MVVDFRRSRTSRSSISRPATPTATASTTTRPTAQHRHAENFAGIDAVWVPFPPADRAANLHECFFSVFGDSPGALGLPRHARSPRPTCSCSRRRRTSTRLPSTPTPPIFFIRQAHLEVVLRDGAGQRRRHRHRRLLRRPVERRHLHQLRRTASGQRPRFTGTFLSAPGHAPITATVHAGDVFRIPGNAYTPSGPYGIVTNPQPNLIQRVYTQRRRHHDGDDRRRLHHDTGSARRASLHEHPGTRASTSPPACRRRRRPRASSSSTCFFTIDNRGATSTGCPGAPSPASPANQNLTAAAIYTTQTGGSFAVINGAS